MPFRRSAWCSALTRRRLDHKKALRLVQQVEISGMGTRTFYEAMNRMEIAQERFSQHFCGFPVTIWKARTGVTGQTLAASNRIFTLKTDYPTEQDTGFQDGMDPIGELEKLKSASLFHSQENIVRYFKRSVDPITG
jgi:hypothetical protein